jgi:hypothetical protein
MPRNEGEWGLMKVSRLQHHFWVLVGVLTLATLACGWGNLEPTPVPTPIDDIGVTPEPDPWWQQMLAGRLVNEAGGYELLGLPGQIPIRDGESIYTNTEAADFDSQNDLNLFVSGSVSQQPATLEQIYAEAVRELGVEPAAPEPIQIDGAPGLRAEFTRTLPDGTIMRGQLVVVQVSPRQRFVMLGESSAEAWDAELGLLFEAVLASVHFIELGSY